MALIGGYAKMFDQQIGRGVIAYGNHGRDELAHREFPAVVHLAHEVGSADEIGAVKGDFFGERPRAPLFVRVGGGHDQHLDDRRRRKRLERAVADQCGPRGHRPRVDADSSGQISSDRVHPGAQQASRLRRRGPRTAASRAEPRKSPRFTNRSLDSGAAREAKMRTPRPARPRRWRV